jgi:hypothetical protein
MRLIFKQQKKRCLSIRKKQLRRARKLRLRSLHKPKNVQWWTDDITAPKVFGILDNDNRNDVIHFISSIKAAAQKRGAAIRLNFKDTEKMYADATLLFKASIEQICQQHPALKIKCAPSKKIPRINEVLTQIRLLHRLGQTFHIKPTDETVIHWRTTEGKGADGEKYEPILGSYDTALDAKLSEGLYLGLTEAMTNTCHHAYPDGLPDTEWWMFSQIKNDWLTVAICDLGVGIPATIHIKQPLVWKVIHRAYKGKATDANIMDATIRLKKTRTRKGYRGKGLTQLANVVDRAQNGAGFFIYSGKGCYAKSSRGVKLYDYKTSIGGTVITWRLPLNSDET